LAVRIIALMCRALRITSTLTGVCASAMVSALIVSRAI
jgi:hypothetical protein